jgi:hypothetical protein
MDDHTTQVADNCAFYVSINYSSYLTFLSMSVSYGVQSAQYRAAIALNNSAVTLLERERYKDSVDTFRIAISLMQSTVVGIQSSNGMEINSFPSYDYINFHLQQTWRRCSLASVESPAVRSDTLAVVKFYSQQDPSAMEDEIIKASRGGQTKVFNCIIIEPAESDDCWMETIGRDSNSILYNFGVAHCLLAFQLGTNSRSELMLADELRQGAFRLFCLIEPFFFASLSDPPVFFQGCEILLLGALFAQTMSEVASYLQHTVVCENYKGTLLAILLSIRVQDALSPAGRRHASAA